MEREEKQALRQAQKKEEMDHLEFQKEQLLKNQQLSEEKRRKEKEEYLIRQKEQIEEI